jgi:predicted transcriptional regulator
MIEKGWDIHESEKTLPVSMGVYDSTVLILLVDENGTEQGFIESDDPVIRSWCEDTFERYRRESHPINTDTFVL